ncbi:MULTISPECIES: hypothetical protein [unclassified Variovorax]|uniref:hypothetical protein n=1 Tax=unclassified Variovorax TaxID=663243 RepID=UPI002575DBE2|nr:MULTISPECIES: hypothetical protein [unclassified Variovorax]MDM0090471.1 hypothetical protein [Variovorax sp. J22G40]MDM0147864.1 hypothetical protein [Variovorax sp. J2P1-31]
MKKPDIKLNPHPRMRYEITLTIADAPGPFDAVEGSAGYQVSNDRCVPLAPISGARPTPRKNVPIALTRVNEAIYKGSLYVDLLVDEDYFGLGLCRWSMPFADFDLQIGNLAFAHSIALEEILAGNSVTRYFNKISYVSEDARSPKNDHSRVSSGNASRAEFKDPGNTFSMTLSAKEKRS